MFPEKLTDEQRPKMIPLAMESKKRKWWKPWTLIVPQVRKWKLLEQWEFEYKEGRFISIYEGFIFDGASIPWFFLRIYSATGYLFLASIPHDYIYQKALFYEKSNNTKTPMPCTRIMADDLFYDICKTYHADHPKKSWLAYKALRLGGGRAWNKHKKIREEKYPAERGYM